MKVLVTGATGMVGNNVVRKLLERGITTRVLARSASAPRPLQGLDVEIVEGDVRDSDAVRRAVDAVDGVVHAAAMVHIGWTRLEEQRQINVDGTRNVALAARDAGARLVHVSSVDALAPARRDQPSDEETPPAPKHSCGYVVTKREAEQVVLDLIPTGLQACIVNPGFMLGPWDWKPTSGRMVLAVARLWMVLAPSGGLSACDVRDVAEAIVTALERGQVGRRYILAGQNMTYFELWRRMAKITHGTAPWMPMGPLQRISAKWIGDLRTRLTGTESDLNSAGVSMSTLYSYYSSQRAKTELNYQSRPVDESIQASWDWLREHGY